MGTGTALSVLFVGLLITSAILDVRDIQQKQLDNHNLRDQGWEYWEYCPNIFGDYFESYADNNQSSGCFVYRTEAKEDGQINVVLQHNNR